MKHSPGFLALVNDAKTRVRETNVADVKARLDRKEPVVLVDVREDHEWNEGHVPGAVHLGRGILERDAEERFPDKNAELIPIMSAVGFGFTVTPVGALVPVQPLASVTVTE